jgi:hypothetical protein
MTWQQLQQRALAIQMIAGMEGADWFFYEIDSLRGMLISHIHRN